MTDIPPYILLFNDERYQRCSLRPGQRLFRYDHLADDRLIGTLSGVIQDGLLDCGHGAPFGGIDWHRRRERVSAIVDLIRAAVSHAAAKDIREIRLRARPAYFGANETAVQFALLNLGASVEACELSLGIETWRYRMPEEYVAALDVSSRNKIRQGLRAGMVFCAAETAADWASCVDLLAETKRRRGVRLKISLDYVMRQRGLFGDRIAMHRLTHDGELAGAALVYRVADDWDYIAAWGDDLRHRNSRVMNLMAYYLVCAAIVQRVKVLDIGISSVDGVPDDGLVQFKRSIGATTGLRLDFRLALGWCNEPAHLLAANQAPPTPPGPPRQRNRAGFRSSPATAAARGPRRPAPR
jgi:hypothetical protein